MRVCMYFFLPMIVATATILSIVLQNGRLDRTSASNTTGNLRQLKGRYHDVKYEEPSSTNDSTGILSDHVPRYESSIEVMLVLNSSQNMVSGDSDLDEQRKSGRVQIRPRLSNEFANQESESSNVISNMLSNMDFLLKAGNSPENVTLFEEVLWSKAKGSINRKIKRDLTNGFIAQDLEKLYGNDVVLSPEELIFLVRQVIEDLEKCDLMSLFSNFVSIPGYDRSKNRKKSQKTSRSKRSVKKNKVNSEFPTMIAENGGVQPDFLKEAQIKNKTEKILTRSKRSFEKIFNFFKPDRALRLVPELIREENYPSEIHKVVTEDGYVLELHRIPAPRSKMKYRKKKFQKRDIHPDSETPAMFLEKLKPKTRPYTQTISLETPQADQVLFPPNKYLDNFKTSNHTTDNNNFKFSASNSEKFKDMSFVDEIGMPSELQRHFFLESDATNRSISDTKSPVHGRMKRSSERVNYYPIFVPENYDSSPEYVTSDLQRKKIPTSSNVEEVFDVFLEKWVPRSRYRRPSVLIHHGLFASSANFVLSDGEGGALAYMLANAGYDVWLGNWRGNTYSTEHANLDSNSRHLDEIIKFDIPAAVNYILAVSGQHDLRYVGHSLGCAMLFGATSEDPSLASKVKMMIAMAPAAFMDNSYGALKSTILSVKNFYYLLDRLRISDLLSPAPVQVQLANHFCGPSSIWRVPCLLMVDAFMGKVKEPMKEYYTNVLLSHFPSTLASTRILAHFGQFVNAHGMRKYNYGPDENYVRYGQRVPPKYSLSTVTFPVVVFWGPGDTVVTPEDALLSAQKLPNLIVAIPVFDEDFNHLDFIFPEQAQGLVYRPILQVLRCCDRQSCDRGTLKRCVKLRRAVHGGQPLQKQSRAGRAWIIRSRVYPVYRHRKKWPWFIPLAHLLDQL
ncbi:AB-hydrolase lipase domain [Trinorchestia longiramus]|nr:AB-hydrolase lipase domain [Trinorchestia longiramus]